MCLPGIIKECYDKSFMTGLLPLNDFPLMICSSDPGMPVLDCPIFHVFRVQADYRHVLINSAQPSLYWLPTWQLDNDFKAVRF